MKMRTRTALSSLALFLVLVLAALGPAQAAPKADLWEVWTKHNPASAISVDHRAWEGVLAKYLAAGADGVNRFAYGRITPEDRKALDAYIAMLAATPVSRLARPEQRAYWINLYNALTVRVILDHSPVDSILNIGISPGLFSIGPWGKKLVRVEGRAVSLDDIEHRILRPIWKDPRVHYAVNCASIGCPNLQATAFTAANTEKLLQKGAREYVNHSRGAHFEGGTLVVSQIYDWYQADFGGTEAGVVRHLKRFAGPSLKKALDGVFGREEISYDYDWNLNEAP